MQESGNAIVDLTYKFSLNILTFTDKLEQMKKFAVANQITKSGTSIGANVRESQAGQSKRDFLSKLKIAEKEMEETEYWLMLCKDSEVLLDPGTLLNDLQPIKKVLGKILSTCYKNGYDK
jgi:four helix bundle protein